MDTQIPPSSSAPQPPKQPTAFPPKKNINKTAGFITGILVLLIAGGALAYWQYKKEAQNNNYNDNNNSADYSNGNNSQPGDSSYPTTTPAYGSIPSVFQKCDNLGPILSSKSGTVLWQNPERQNLHLFASSSPNSAFDYDESFLVGHFTSGQYAGGDLLVTVAYFNEPGGYYWYHIVKKGEKYYFLNKYSDPLYEEIIKSPLISMSEDKNFDLPDLNLPDNFHLDNPSANFTLSGNLGFFKNRHDFFCGESYSKVFSVPNVGDFYTDATTSIVDEQGRIFSSRNGFYIKTPDGLSAVYALDIPIIGKDNIPQVFWNVNKKNTEEYSYQHLGGCGSSNFRDVADIDLSALSQTGTDSFGQPIYEFKDSNSQELQDKYNDIYVPEGETKISYSNFISEHPIFFWKDQFGKFIRFTTKKFQPLAECGKPVIYLYPEKTEKISVKLNPVGGFTYTEPAYNSGWNVIADPNSNITNLADGKVYPYLFWEGRGGMYETPKQGFVVVQKEVHQFLIDKLHLLGLNDKESADFMEFWEPKMQSSPYYFVTFMGNQVMDELAPLSVTPKPDTIIRILMDFTPLTNPIKVQGFNIRTPVRKGFTVVEWGGVLR